MDDRGGRGRGRGQPAGGRGEGDENERGLPQAMGGMRLTDSDLRGLGRGSTRGIRGGNSNSLDLVKTHPGSVPSKQGKGGRQIELVTNYFRFGKRHDFRLLQYRVDLSLEEDRTFVRKVIVQRCRESLPPYIFDGTMLFTTRSVFANAQQQELRITSLREDREAGTQEPCDVIIRNQTELRPTDCHYVQFYNILLRRTMEKMELKLLGRNYFDPKHVVKMPEWNLEVWPGYVTSIRQHEREVLLCAEVASKVVRTDTARQQLMLNCRNKVDLKSGLIGAVVMTKYNERTYRVDDVDTSRNPLSTFEMADGSTMSYVEYYRTRYQVHIRDTSQPLLVSLPKERDRRGGRNSLVMLVPELCYMTGLTEEMRSDFKRMAALSEHTRMAPPVRVAALEAFAKTLTGNEACKTALQDWGMKMNESLLRVPGRVLRLETIQMKRPVSCDRNPGDWTRGLGGVGGGLLLPTPISRWICVYPKREKQRMESFWKAMQESKAALGIELQEPKWVEIAGTHESDYMRAIREWVERGPNFIMVVIPNERGIIYQSCKKFLCVEKPVPSQFITVNKVLSKETKHRQMAMKVLVQMTTKLGGAPWTVDIPADLSDTMVAGFDTYHDTEKKGNSVGALVASINRNFTRYVSLANEHLPKEEISNSISALMSAALKKYSEVNKTFPKKIFFYRDGVGDGQLQDVHGIELESVKAMFGQLQEGYNPMLAYIVVSKRINSRFFEEVNGKSGNPPCGTVVDDVVTLPERYDFFLIPQSVRQGTVNPTSFNVIHDTVGLAPERLQQLTYKMCHLYYNWSGTVRVPAPCQYAHKLAYLMGESLHAAPSPHLADLLFYL